MIARAKRWLHPYPDTAGALRLGFVAAYIGVVGALVVYINLVAACNEGLPHWRQWGMAGLLGLMLLLERFELTREMQPTPRPLAIGLLVIRAALIQGVVSLDCTNLAIILYPLVPFTTFFVLGSEVSWLAGLGYWLWVAARAWQFGTLNLQTNFNHLTIMVVYTLLLIFMRVLAGHIDRDQRSRQEMKQLLVELEASHRQLQAYADRVAELAAAAERNRLARDIHDTLGHHLTAISIQLEKAQAYRDRNPAEADRAIRDAKLAAQTALHDVRQSVAALRATEERFSLVKSLADLVNRLDQDALAVEYHTTGDETGYANPVLLTLYRAAQEGLTNIQKHARASHAALEVQLGDEEARLSLRDDGAGFDTARLAEPTVSLSHSFGLRGLRERLESVRGQMRITSDPQHGTELTVVVPKNPAKLVRK
jgi:signal transduction histidine kinase